MEFKNEDSLKKHVWCCVFVWDRVGEMRTSLFLFSLILLVTCEDLTQEQKEKFHVFFQNISFVHIPKNGGSTMERTIKKMADVHFGYAAFLSKTLNTTDDTFLIDKSLYCPATPRGQGCVQKGLCAEGTCAFWHIPPYTYHEPLHPTLVKDLRFCHIRNPFTRSVSEVLYIHHSLRQKPLEKILGTYIPTLKAVRSNQGGELNAYRKTRYYEGNPAIVPINAPPHPAHQVPAVTPSASDPSVVIPFPATEDPSDPTYPQFPHCFLNPHEHCHHIPESRFVEPFVTADYVQDLYFYLEKTDMECYQILRMLQEKHETPLTKSTGINCNFPLRFEWYAHDFNLLLQRCGPIPDYVHPGEDTPDTKYHDILAVPEVKELLQEIFWEDVLRFGYNEYPL